MLVRLIGRLSAYKKANLRKTAAPLHPIHKQNHGLVGTWERLLKGMHTMIKLQNDPHVRLNFGTMHGLPL